MLSRTIHHYALIGVICQAAGQADGVEYIAPIDSDQGGTWLVANAHGLTAGVLNYYPRGVNETGRESRAHLPLV